MNGDYLGALVHFSADFPAIVWAFQALAAVMGIIMIAHAVIRIAKHGESQMQGHQQGVGDAVFEIFLGAALLNIGWIASGVFTTLAGSPGVTQYEAISYPVSGLRPELQAGLDAILGFLSMVGWIGFIRGIIILKRAGDYVNGNQDTLWQGVVFLFGGAMAINIAPTFDAVRASFGL